MKIDQKLAAVRKRIAALESELVELENPICTRPETEARVDAFVQGQAARLLVPVYSLTRTEAPSPGGIAAPHVPLRSELDIIADPEGSGTLTTNVAPVLAALFPDELRRFLLARVDAKIGDGWGMGADEVRARRIEIDAEILMLEREEERHVVALETTGADVQRRADIRNAWVVVEFVDDVSGRRAA